MGATTLYHPVALNVIRGAAEYCGWKFSKIMQTSADREMGFASYILTITRMPGGMDELPNRLIVKQLSHCFMYDIIVKRVYQTPKGDWKAAIDVDLNVVKENGIMTLDVDAENEIRS